MVNFLMTLKVTIITLSPINEHLNYLNDLECNGAVNLMIVNLRGLKYILRNLIVQLV